MWLYISQANSGIRRLQSRLIQPFQSFTELTVQDKQYRSCYKRISNSIEVSIIRNSDMNCCSTETSIPQSASEVNGPVSGEASESLRHGCTNCGAKSRPVSRKTVLLTLKPELLEQAMTGTYGFCSARDCPIVYFEDQASHRFTIDDLRGRVGLK